MNTDILKSLEKRILNGGNISKDDALTLMYVPLEHLCESANEIRSVMCGNGFDLCSIINAKCGKCSENCKYCAQSSHYSVNIDEYPLITAQAAVKQAIENEKKGILRFSIVTSGRALNNSEVDMVCDIIRAIRSSSSISVCGSFGLLNGEQYKKLKAAGLSRVHNNLETSRRFFPNICTTHTYDDKLKSIRAALNAGLSVCSGGIMGLGELMEDRIDMAIEIRNLGIRSVPINILNPIKGTPFENNKILPKEEILRICAIFRFINPTASLRLAGGRSLMDDHGELCFKSGVNAAITMDMLTTSGITTKEDLKMLKKLNYKAVLMNE